MRTREEIESRSQWQTAEMFARHELLDETYWKGGARWMLGHFGSRMLHCEIFVSNGAILFHGDFDVMRFAHYGDAPDPWSCLRWMGDSELSSYVVEKASIGMGRRTDDTMRYVQDVAIDDLNDQMEHEKDDDVDSRYLEVLKEARDFTESEHHLREFLCDNDHGWDLWEHSYGHVVADRLIVAHTALQTCVSLLRQRYGRQGPPRGGSE